MERRRPACCMRCPAVCRPRTCSRLRASNDHASSSNGFPRDAENSTRPACCMRCVPPHVAPWAWSVEPLACSVSPLASSVPPLASSVAWRGGVIFSTAQVSSRGFRRGRRRAPDGVWTSSVTIRLSCLHRCCQPTREESNTWTSFQENAGTAICGSGREHLVMGMIDNVEIGLPSDIVSIVFGG